MPEKIPVVLKFSGSQGDTLYGAMDPVSNTVAVGSYPGAIEDHLARVSYRVVTYTANFLTSLGWRILPLTRID